MLITHGMPEEACPLSTQVLINPHLYLLELHPFPAYL